MKEKHPCLEIRWMCDRLNVSPSGYYSYLKATKRPADRQELDDMDLIRWAYDFKGRAKGARQIKMTLRHEKGKIMNLKKIRRLMKKMGLFCPIRKANPLRRMAKALKTNSVFTNKLNRQFATSRPGQHLLTDITYLYYGYNGRAYLSTIKDASTNEIIAYSVSERIDMTLVMDMLSKLDSIEWLPEQFLIHSDQGCHYTSVKYQKHLADKGITQSMSRKGNCWDNATMESFFGHMKDELHLENCLTFEQLEKEINDYMDYYNHSRCQWDLKQMTPCEYREYLFRQPGAAIVPMGEKNCLLGLVQEGNLQLLCTLFSMCP